MPLTLARHGNTCVIKRITGKDDTIRHLENMGLIIGHEVTVITESAGNLILKVKGCRIAVDKALAARIYI
ncbi:FeoA family protein [Breznakiella homolactica]|uniref:Ferrous iron transport protein A n=1 Tax=Breznakiella homolactica TaxID=2798577 RepID=A0A7T7XM12_9SPIR|nr:FeoA family protein [Breznakiella homolactica]QQO08866.1 ferrous iron transport protein A [Breznakiella homolactica]